MKKKYFFFIALFAFYGVNAQSWQSIYKGISFNIYSVYFTDVNTGYIAGENNTIYKTTDGGSSWLLQYTDTSDLSSYWDLLSIYFPDKNTGYAVGAGGQILKTTNGGNNWFRQFISNKVDSDYIYDGLNSVYFKDVNTGFIGGSNCFLKTNDGGTTWIDSTFRNTGYPKDTISRNMNSVYFINNSTGYAAGDASYYGGFIQKTIDGGKTWNYQKTKLLLTFNSIYFPTADIGYAVGDTATIFKTINGGADWIQQNTGASGFSTVFFLNADTGYAGGSDIWKTIDGGTNWIQQNSGAFNDIMSIFFVNKDIGYAVGLEDDGKCTILKTTNGGNSIAEFSSDQNILIYPNPAKNLITVEIPQTVAESLLTISDISGKELLKQNISQNKSSVDISQLPSGFYFVRVMNDKTIETKKIIKE